ncbi:ECs_2282 family putative zinc-binding protein [Facklamia miroungae]|uniref:C2H2-type domain-containing protein n=1 Tax=Facklamia miroungae TaxID=120956 RepID=A0A1G7RGV8_9LACT|nr:hypothetical protein [Facklamia miroungae]NKZ29439.1 hypothetical protein [Facklamia miroungae]SDG09290.1 hypothetical protein SAMN05421791_10316 [Facklamia miroungae]
MKDLSRNIELNCPICANDQFEYDSELESTTYKCSDCGKEFTKDELLEANEYKINANLEDVKQEALMEIEKELKKIFKKSK